jgi:tripartite-type tricarboxylate transporter receptor subunit TctC
VAGKAHRPHGAKRSSVLPDLPDAAESGHPGLLYVSRYGLSAPKGATEGRVQLLNKAVNEAVTELTKAGAFATPGIEPVHESVEQFRKYIAQDVTDSGELLKDAGFKPE